MLGIPGLDAVGAVHSAFGVLALLLGLMLLLQSKGSRRHKRLGYGYAAAMLLLNATALVIYDLTGRFGPFHAAAVVSLASTGLGVFFAATRRPRATWLDFHAHTICWSYIGLVAAFIAEILARTPSFTIRRAAGAGVAVAVCAGAMLVYTRLPGTIARQRNAAANARFEAPAAPSLDVFKDRNSCN